MTAITVTNIPDTIIDEMVATLLAGTISTASIFDVCEKTNSVDRFKETRLSGHGNAAIAAIMSGPIEESILTDERVGNVIEFTILTASQATPETANVTEAKKLTAAVKNLLNGDIPSSAAGFFKIDDEAMTLRIAWGEPEYDVDSKKPWAFGETPCFIAYVTTNDTSH